MATPVEQYVWHPYYIDALAVHTRDANADGDYNDLNEAHYYTHDGNFNVTALLDSGGNVIQRYTYSPYGQPQVREADFALDPDNRTGNGE